MNKNPDNLRSKANAGFSLVDVMVGMVIALLGTIIIFQVFSVSEGIKRTTTSGGDALQNGAAALFALENSLKQAGYGFFAVANGATLATGLGAPPNPATCIATGVSCAPVWITPGAANASDSITITYRQNWDYGAFAPDPAVFTSVSAVPPALTVETITVQTHCIVNGVDNGSTLPQLCSSLNGVIADGIVLMKAEYGIDVNNDGVIDSTEWGQTAPTLVQLQNELIGVPPAFLPAPAAVRIAVVARSAQPEKPSVLGGACDTTTAYPTSTLTSVVDEFGNVGRLSLSGNVGLAAGDDWKCYRYKTFENTVTIRW